MASLVTQHTPPPPGPEKWIERLKANDQVTVIVLSHLWGVWYHWMGKGSSAHTDPQTECAGCLQKAPLKWHAYIHAYDYAGKKDFFLELTTHTVERMREKSGIDGTDFRGCRFRFKRGDGKQARIWVEYLQRVVLDDTMPEGRSPERELRILWKIPEENGEHKTN